ncbi:MAG: hypothetical protein M3R70_08640 [Actinomycetota bacterium]|nr:hypothetical protein [Actinomycetota bacterium]
MTDLAANLDPLGRDLHEALRRRTVRRARRRRTLRVTAATTVVLGAFSAAALASGLGPDLQLDPTKWSILGAGSVDNGRGEYVHARDKATGAHSSFSVEHDAGLPRYDAFLLNQRLFDAKNATAAEPAPLEPGALCTAAQLTRAESVALATLRSSFPPGAAPNATKSAVDAAVRAEFVGSPCRGLEYAGEQARFVFAGIEPASSLMPGAR